ncbi:hypothetical protein RclHR1_30630003 [Rhizophagus clarus]|uniref:RNase H type-1 domain-containing protein n=1 Tax=Rhizophagus clarus TaxID=94130 RepID=A0A2Z6S0C3_9GLOM|nr:hypothetical protein RclHR1_30630003 [Rhizophagus clarus]
MGWSWIQIISDAGYLNSVATYAHGTICNWPSSTRAEAAAIYAALSVTSDDFVVSIYTDSQAAIDGLRSCASSTYTNSRFYYKTTNFELWASLEHDAFPIPKADITFSHLVRLAYDDVVCESNPRRLFKTYYQATYMKALLSLRHFQFTFWLTDRNDYVVDWDLTWFTLNFSLAHDASFQAHHASRHYTFKFKLFLDDLPLLEKLKVTRLDLYIDLLTYFTILPESLVFKLHEAGELANVDPIPMLWKLSSFSCWTISSSNWSFYALIRSCLPTMFINLFVDLSIPRQSAMKVVAVIHNNFIQKLRKRIWNLRTYDKSKWEDAMNITLKLKTTPQPSNLPATSYVPFSSLPLLTQL